MEHPIKMKRLAIIAGISLGVFLFVWAGFSALNFIRDINPNIMLPNRSSVALPHEFDQDIQAQIESYGYVDFNQLADFEWSHMLIVRPYQDPWQLLENNGIQRQRLNTGIRYEDWQNLLIFLNNDRVAAYINLPRSTADFRSAVRDDMLLERESTVFYVLRPESIWDLWHGPDLANWVSENDFPLNNPRWEEIADTIRGDNESEWIVAIEPTDPDALARHERSRELYPFAPNSTILYVPLYDEGALPDYIVAEIVSLSLYQSPNPPGLPVESMGNQNYKSGELLGLYTGTINYVRSFNEYIGDDWWAIASWWQGTLYLVDN